MKQLPDKDMEKLAKIADIDLDKGVLTMRYHEDTNEYQTVKPLIYDAKYKGWKVIMLENATETPETAIQPLKIHWAEVYYHLLDAKASSELSNKVTLSYCTSVTGEIDRIKQDKTLERRILNRTGKDNTKFKISVQDVHFIKHLGISHRKN